MPRHHSIRKDSDSSEEEEQGLLSSDEEEGEKHHSRAKSNGRMWWIAAAILLVIVLGGGGYLYSQRTSDATGPSSSAEANVSAATGGTTPRAEANTSTSKTGGGAAATPGTMAGASQGSPSATAATKTEAPPPPVAAPTPVDPNPKKLPVFTAVVGVVNPTTTQSPAADKPKTATETYKWPASASTAPTETPSAASKLSIDFSAYNSAQSSLVDFLGAAGFLVGDWEVPSEPLSYSYTPDNLAVVDQALRLSVPPVDEGATSTTGAQIFTNVSDVGYGFITTRARLSPVHGIRQTMVYTSSEYSGLEIGCRSSYYGSTQGVRGVTPGVALTVQNDESASMSFAEYRDDPSEAFHDYGVYWSPGLVQLFIDKEEHKSIDGNVPERPGSVHWGAWSNGHEQWSAGPPGEKATYQIEWIDGWWMPM